MPFSNPSASNLQQLVSCGFAARAIRRKARQLAGRCEFGPSDLEDIEQELRLHLLCRLSKFDPQIAHWNVFVRTLLERRAATLVAQRRARMRASATVAHCEDSHEVRVDIAIDTAATLARLPRKDRALCERLKKHSVAEVARQLGIPRSTLRDEIRRLRRQFATAGMGAFPKFVRHFAVGAGR